MYAHAHIGNSKYLKMHRLIAKVEYGKSELTVDHIDRNGSNNISINLRYASDSQQCHNKGDYNSNTSGIKGVRYEKRVGKWRAEMSIQGKRYIKQFPTMKEAIEQRLQWETMTP